MLKTLSADIEFHNKKTIKFSHSFLTGMTAITGPNESGKSLRLEMLRYSLFGAAALRRSISTYNKLNVSVELEINGVGYKITRDKSGAKLYVNGTVQATGTTPVNRAVLKIFGYNLEVFDIANVCLQDDITSMTKKTPAERKRMIDKTLGLDAVDTLLKNTSEELSAIRAVKSTLEAQLQGLVITPPEKPEGYLPLEMVSSKLEEAQQKKFERDQMKTELAKRQCEKPSVPEFDFLKPDKSLEYYVNAGAQNFSILESVNNLKKTITNITVLDRLKNEDKLTLQYYLDTDVEGQWTRYREYERAEKEAKECKFTREQIDTLTLGIKYAPEINKLNALMAGEKVCCPECSHTFSLQQSQLDTLVALIPQEAYSALVYVKDTGITTMAQVTRLVTLLEAKERFDLLDKVDEPKDIYIGTSIDIRQKLAVDELNCQKYSTILELEKQIAELESRYVTDVDIELTRKKLVIDAETKYEKELENFNVYTLLLSEYTPKLQALEGVEDLILELNTLQDAIVKYKILVGAFEQKIAQKADIEEQLDLASLEYTRLMNIRNALTSIKPKVKSYLVPSLSSVASNFISQMTNNARNKVDISEEFDIVVDNQAVEELSGSGKAVANLAIRLALGIVLTNKIFSVFMADEVDAAMDNERAESTSQCLKNLTTTFDQVILVSHKKPQADNYIELTRA